MADLYPFDARCHACGRTHIVYVMASHEPGETIRIAHNSGLACGEGAEHTLLRKLDGLARKRGAPPS